mgnify:CR=1 FL=1
MDLEQLSKRELIGLIKSLMKEMRELKRNLGYEKIEKLSQMYKPVVKKEEPKKPGAKQGHEGVTRPKPEKVDEEKKLVLKKCPKSKWSREKHKLVRISEVRERIIEDIKIQQSVKTTKYILQGYWCGICKKKFFPKVPDAMPRFRLGMNFCNYVCERKFGYRMTYNLIQKDLKQNFGLFVSQATLVKAVHATAKLLGKMYEAYKQTLRKGKSVNIDETGWRINGSNFWLWKFRSEDTVVTVIDFRRSHDIPENVIGKEYAGTVGRDGFQAYNLLNCEKQQCWTHILRNSKKITEKYPTDAVMKFHNSLKKIHEQSNKYRKPRKFFERKVKELCKTSKSIHIKTIKKFLIKNMNELFVFMENPIDSTNNTAERAIRPDVVIRKISGGNRSYRGKRSYEILSSVIQTCQLRNEDFGNVVMNELKSTANG